MSAPMAGGPSTPELVRAVSGAGGLGMLAAGYKSAGQVAAEVASVAGVPFGVNLFVPGRRSDPAPVQAYAARLQAEGLPVGEPRWDDDGWDDKLAAVAGVPVVSFTFGCPSPDVVRDLRAAGSAVVVTVTTAEEAVRAGDVDGLLLQGAAPGRAGGSRAGRRGRPAAAGPTTRTRRCRCSTCSPPAGTTCRGGPPVAS